MKAKRTTKKTTKPPCGAAFTLSGYINGEVFSVETDDIAKTIESIAPSEILTESYMTLSRGEGADKIVNEQRLNFIKTKRVFRDEITREIFVQNLLLPFN